MESVEEKKHKNIGLVFLYAHNSKIPMHSFLNRGLSVFLLACTVQYTSMYWCDDICMCVNSKYKCKNININISIYILICAYMFTSGATIISNNILNVNKVEFKYSI